MTISELIRYIGENGFDADTDIIVDGCAERGKFCSPLQKEHLKVQTDPTSMKKFLCIDTVITNSCKCDIEKGK